MKIGIDFDNTIVCYDKTFHRVAVNYSMIPADVPPSKVSVKKYLIDQNQEATWTELQGLVYGKEILGAAPFPEVINVLQRLGSDHELFIISHRSKFPYAGEKVNLHVAANTWLSKSGFLGSTGININNIFFNETLEDKLSCVADIACDAFIDDLPNVLLHERMPGTTKKIWFNYQSSITDNNAATQLNVGKDWRDIELLLA